mmetsp:Transcript_5227/g.13761  ORF Transcript_5227/g.13761 Transcript_5227/m.13761 type:complete len:91 (+) Transcript_5227:258-530(+)
MPRLKPSEVAAWVEPGALHHHRVTTLCLVCVRGSTPLVSTGKGALHVQLSAPSQRSIVSSSVVIAIAAAIAAGTDAVIVIPLRRILDIGA